MAFANSVILYNCKLNHNGLFCVDFATAGQGGTYQPDGARRDSVMSSTNAIATVKFTYTSMTYMRKDKVIVVDENADVLDAAGVNYCRYINPDFSSSMYFYAFIDKIEYVAPSTSRLHIRTDCFMTYMDKIEWGDQYVERATFKVPYYVHGTEGSSQLVLSKGGEFITEFLSENGYTAPRCFESSQMYPLNFAPYDGTDNNGWVVINIKKDPFKLPNEPTMSSITPVLSGLPQGTYWLAVAPTKLWLFTDIINGPQSGARFNIEDVVAMYYVPKACITTTSGAGDYQVVAEGAGAACDYYKFEVATGWKGDTIVVNRILNAARDMNNYHKFTNGALNRYPYNFFKITDRAGHEWIFKPELFEHNDSDGIDIVMKYKRYFSLGDNGVSVGFKILNYMEAPSNDCLCIFQRFPQITVNSDYYQQYLAMNKNSLENQYQWMRNDMSLGIINAGIDIGRGIYNKKASGIEKGTGELFNSAINYERQTSTFEAKMADLKNYPASTICTGSGNLAMIMDSMGLFFERWSIDAGAAVEIDEIFDRHGYAINRPCKYNPASHRVLYAYVKTANCNITGVIPESDRREINELFNAGITIWHLPTGYGYYNFAANIDISDITP